MVIIATSNVDFFSVYPLGNEALVILSNLSQLMAEKLEEPISHVRGWFNRCIAITLTGLYSRIIYGYCLTSPLQERNPD